MFDKLLLFSSFYEQYRTWPEYRQKNIWRGIIFIGWLQNQLGTAYYFDVYNPQLTWMYAALYLYMDQIILNIPKFIELNSYKYYLLKSIFLCQCFFPIYTEIRPNPVCHQKIYHNFFKYRKYQQESWHIFSGLKNHIFCTRFEIEEIWKNKCSCPICSANFGFDKQIDRQTKL